MWALPLPPTGPPDPGVWTVESPPSFYSSSVMQFHTMAGSVWSACAASRRSSSMCTAVVGRSWPQPPHALAGLRSACQASQGISDGACAAAQPAHGRLKSLPHSAHTHAQGVRRAVPQRVRSGTACPYLGRCALKPALSLQPRIPYLVIRALRLQPSSVLRRSLGHLRARLRGRHS